MLGFYIGSYASEEEKGILFCQLNPETGEMKVKDGIAGIANPSFLALNKDKTRLYSVSEEENFQGEPSGGLASYKIDNGINIPHLLNTMPSMGKAPCHISLSPDEKFLFAANYTSGNISSYFLNDDGSLKFLSDTKQHHGSSLNPERQEGPHAHMIQPTQDGNFVVTADLGMDQLLIYGFDSKKGKFIDLPEKTVKVSPGQGPRHFIFHPNHPRLYLINELGNTLMTFSINLSTCLIEGPDQTIETLPSDFNETSYTADLHLHPNGKFLYGSNRGHNTLVCFSVDSEDQSLSVRSHTPSGGIFPRNFAFEPSGKILIAANQDSFNLQSFSVNPDSGALSPLHSLKLEVKPVCVLFN